jgi:hypothetical protein
MGESREGGWGQGGRKLTRGEELRPISSFRKEQEFLPQSIAPNRCGLMEKSQVEGLG